MIALAVIGAAGRMGCAVVRGAARIDGVRVVAAVERSGEARLGMDAGRAAGTAELDVAITDDLAVIERADVCIDFSAHEAVPRHLEAALAHGVGIVIGATGLTREEIAAINRAAIRIPVFWSANMSMGMNVVFALVERTAALLGPDYDIEIVEAHHRFKRDAPSGTALTLGHRAAAGRGVAMADVADFGRHGDTGERVKGRMAFHAVRGGDIVGDHTVMFAGEGERVELTHRATSRDVFAIGALRAALWLRGRDPGLYDMQTLLGL